MVLHTPQLPCTPQASYSLAVITLPKLGDSKAKPRSFAPLNRGGFTFGECALSLR
jgi:hypothetical protein